MSEERKTVEGLIDVLDGLWPSDHVESFHRAQDAVEACARALVKQSVEQGSALQRLTDACQAEEAPFELETMRSVAKSHHDDLVAAQQVNADLLSFAREVSTLMVGFEINGVHLDKRAKELIARAEAAQKGKA